MDRVLMEEMTWPEIKAAMESGKKSVFVPVASIEQHGPALPLITDMVLGRAIGEHVARKMGDVLVAPPVAPGCSSHHMAWPGTISVTPQLLEEMVRTWVSAYQHHGFEEVVLYASHGGNFGPLDAICKKIIPEFKNAGLRVIGITDIQTFFAAWFGALKAAGRDDATESHADVAETSIMLAVRPDLVRVDKMEPGYTGKVDLSILFREGMPYYTKNGVLGDPTGSSAKIGNTMLDLVADYFVREIKKARAS